MSSLVSSKNELLEEIDKMIEKHADCNESRATSLGIESFGQNSDLVFLQDQKSSTRTPKSSSTCKDQHSQH